MSIQSIEARAADFLIHHKQDLARFLARAEHMLRAVGQDVEELFTEGEPRISVSNVARIDGARSTKVEYLGGALTNDQAVAAFDQVPDTQPPADWVPGMEHGTDPEIIDVPPASTAPEVLDPETQEPIPSTDTATIEGADAADPEHPLAALQAAEDHIEATKDAE